jgi:hypothetical protein
LFACPVKCDEGAYFIVCCLLFVVCCLLAP